VDALVTEIDQAVPPGAAANSDFRSDMAGLLTVLICACYENCVKEIISLHTARRHADFSGYASRRYAKINSKIDIQDLLQLSAFFGDSIKRNFKNDLDNRRDRIERFAKVNIKESYTQILRWRHDFAHTGNRNTTIEEVLKLHVAGKRVIYSFAEAFGN
jgi:hypothetical protein